MNSKIKELIKLFSSAKYYLIDTSFRVIALSKKDCYDNVWWKFIDV